MRIMPDGKVGIGTTDPKENVHIWGAGTQVLAIQGDSGTGPKFTIRGGGTLTFSNDTTPYMNLNASGRFTLNTYGSGTHTGVTAYKLSVTSGGIVIETPIGAGAVDGAGTANYVSKWTDGDTIGNSSIFDNGTSVGINQTSPQATNRLEVNGQTRIVGGLIVGSSALGQGVAPRELFIKGGGTQGIRIEDSTSTNYVYDLTVDFTNGFRIKDVTSSIDAFTIEKTTGYVGIGTTNPTNQFQIGLFHQYCSRR